MSAPSSIEPDVIDIVVRCRNEMPYTQRTLAGLRAQRRPAARVLFIDCASGDGSREAAEAAGASILDITPEMYVPGRVLNAGMERTRSPFVAFVNADAVPLDDGALGRLIAPLVRDARVIATYGRQVPREDADALTKADYARTFGESAAVQTRRGLFFSMAASAVRRDAWQALPFDEDLRYSEDVDWTRRACALGFTVEYVPDAVFEHSHTYSLAAHWKRRAGEGAADNVIFRLGGPTVIGDLLSPLAGSILRDVRSGLLSPTSLATRVAQAGGYFSGRLRATRR